MEIGESTIMKDDMIIKKRPILTVLEYNAIREAMALHVLIASSFGKDDVVRLLKTAEEKLKNAEEKRPKKSKNGKKK